MPAPSETPEENSRPVVRCAGEILAVLVVCFIVGGVPAPDVNETHYLTKAAHYWNPRYCPGDFFLDSTDAHLVFFWTVGWLAKFFSLPAVAWIGRVAAWILIAAGWRALWNAVVEERTTSLQSGSRLLGLVTSAALFLLLIQKCNFAGEWVVGGVEGKCFAYGLVFFGLADVARGRWTTPWIWFGAAAAFHVLVGGWAVLAAGVVWLAEPRATRTPLTRLLPGLVAGGLLSLPGVLPVLALNRGVDPAIIAEGERIYVFERLPHHLAPLSLPWDEVRTRLVRFGALVALMLALWGAMCRRESGLAGSSLSRLMRFAAVALAANLVAALIELTVSNPDSAARFLRYYWNRQADVAVPLAVALAATLQLLKSLRSDFVWRRFAAAAVLLAIGLELTRSAAGRIEDPAPPAIGRLTAPADWIAACTWIRDHAPPEAICLVPRYGQAFNWYAERADVANWKDMPQNAAGIVEWKRRIEELFPPTGPLKTPVREPSELGVGKVRELAAKYGAAYVLTPAYPPLDLKQVFPADDDESDYIVYELPSDAVDGAKAPSSP